MNSSCRTYCNIKTYRLDEATTHNFSFKALVKRCDIMLFLISLYWKFYFKGKIVVLGGDFPKILLHSSTISISQLSCSASTKHFLFLGHYSLLFNVTITHHLLKNHFYLTYGGTYYPLKQHSPTTLIEFLNSLKCFDISNYAMP